MKPVSLAEFSSATFVDLPRSRFRVYADNAPPVEIELVEATTSASSRVPARVSEASFSLVFAGPRKPFLSQRTYRVEHEKLGVFDLFLVPIGEDQHGFRYEAVFNRDVRPGHANAPALTPLRT
jgi:hypothetical protein